MNISTFIIDCDGVLNDGKQAHTVITNSHSNYLSAHDENGGFMSYKEPAYSCQLEKPFKTFHSRDKTAIRRMTESGIRVIIVSADDSPITKAWAESCGAEYIHERIKTLEGYNIDWDHAVGVGDDVMDLVFLKKCAGAYCPLNSHETVRSFAVIINVEGGDGVISELEYKIFGKKTGHDNRVSA